MGDAKTIDAQAGDSVTIHWRLPDGSIHSETYTIPPAPVRYARRLDVIGGPGGKASVTLIAPTPTSHA